MKKTTLSLLFVGALSLFGWSQGQSFDWAKKVGGGNTDAAYFNTIDAQGNVYYTGHFNGTANFNPGGTFNLTSAGQSDIFVSKLDSAGNFGWAIRMGGTGIDYGYSIAIDASNNLFVCGYFNGTVDFDPTGGTTNLVSSGSADAFIAKYSSSGTLIWAKKIGGSFFDIAYSLALDPLGNVYTTGYYAGTVNFNPAGSFNMTSGANSADVFVTKFDTNGNFIWAKNIGGDMSDIAYKLIVDNNSNVIVTGQFEDAADFDPSGSIADLVSLGASDIFIVKLTSAGNYVWAKRMGGTATDESGSITTDASGNIYAGGRFDATADFGANSFTTNGFNDAYLIKLDANGNFLWAKQFGGTSNDAVYAVHTDASGNVYSTGYFYDVVDFDPSNSNDIHTSFGSADIFINKFDSNGNYIWGKQMGGTGFDTGLNLHVTPTNRIYTVGSFASTANFNPAGSFNLTAFGTSDAFIHRMKPCTNTSGSINITGCLSATLNSITYTSTGTYTQTLTNAAGCDSTLTVNVRISNVTSTVVSSNPTCVGGNNGTATVTPSGGILPYSFSWAPSGGTNATAGNLAPATYTCTITDSIGCTALQYATIAAPAPTQIPDICMVTTDGQSVNNIIYWDRTLYPQADSFIVYREVSTNIYLRIGAVSIDSTAEFTDTTRSVGPANGDPNVGSYRYKLQLLDTCGNYSGLSPYHNTIYIIDAGLGQFTWNIPYTIEGGSNPVANYILLCDTANVDVWGPVATVSGTQSTAVDPGFSNHAAIANWRVKTAWGITCDPTRATINTTRSNIKRGSMVTSINDMLNKYITVYPNPANNYFTIQQPQFTKASTISIYNAIGELVYQTNTSNLLETINTENLATGVYTVSIQTQFGTVFKKLIKQ